MFNLDEKNKEILVHIPLTTTSGKIRVKERNFLNEYGLPVATRSIKFTQKHYIEWQIGYDNIIESNKLNIFLDKIFVGANGKNKTLFELSEYFYYFFKWNIITKEKIVEIENFIKKNSETIELKYNIWRSDFKNIVINNMEFLEAEVRYPLLIHKFKKYDIITEIIIKEKQRAIGIMPMLYLCFPITELKSNLLGRTAETKETADFILNSNNVDLLIELFKIFGILSNSHREDILKILGVIKNG